MIGRVALQEQLSGSERMMPETGRLLFRGCVGKGADLDRVFALIVAFLRFYLKCDLIAAARKPTAAQMHNENAPVSFFIVELL